MPKPEDFVKDQFPVRYWPVIPRTFKTAYQAADALIRDTPILQVKSAQDNRGRIVSFAVDLGIERAIESGALDCDFRWKHFAKPTGRYLELLFSHSTASISQVPFPHRQPRNVVFRENARLNSQQVLDIPELKDDLEISGAPHFLIVHGYQVLSFAHIGVPSAQSQVCYEWRSENLMKIPHEIETEGPAPEDTDYNLDEMNLIKEEIEKWRRDNDGK